MRAVLVIAAATAIGPMNSIATLLPRSVRARPRKKNVFINAVAIPNTAAAASCGASSDAVRRARRGSTRRRRRRLAAMPPSAGRPRRTAGRRSSRPCTGRSPRARTAARAPPCRGTGRCAATGREAPGEQPSIRRARGRWRQISCHSGWKLNQPASGNPVCSARVRGVLVVDLLRLAGRHRQQLRLARALHRDEPERCLVDRLADREQAVVLVDRRLAGGNAAAISLPASTSKTTAPPWAAITVWSS